MKKTSHQRRFADFPHDYAGLCRLHLPRPIHDRVDYANTTGITDAMAGHDLTPDQEDYFDLLCGLIEDYDRKPANRSARQVTGLDALRHLLDEHGGSGPAAWRPPLPDAMILRGERQLTLRHVRTLAAHFGVSADLFIEPFVSPRD